MVGYYFVLEMTDSLPRFGEDIVLIDLPMQRPESYAFSVPITSIYSLIVLPPTLSSWCTCDPLLNLY